MGKRAIISRHIVTYKSRVPIYGVILIKDEVIQEVVVVDENIPASALVEKYSDWNIDNFEHMYVSPGVIDLNVRQEWESQDTLSMMGASGGVTFILKEAPIYREEVPEETPLYCDLGISARLDSASFETVRLLLAKGPFAFKAYLYPASDLVSSLPPDLPAVFSRVRQSGLPLIIDASLPVSRMLYMASPCRHISLHSRIRAEISTDLEFFAGAFPDPIYAGSDNEEEEDIEYWTIDRTRSISLHKSKRKPSEQCNSQDNFPDLENITSRDRGMTTKQADQRRRSSFHDIYDDLDYRIRTAEYSIESLSKAEQSSYEQAGKTLYTNFQRRRSNSFQNIEIHAFNTEESKNIPYEERIKPKRPMPLSTKRDVMFQKDREYLSHLANCSDKWETRGVDKVLQLLSTEYCKVHFANLSCASSVNKIRLSKKHLENISCETCVHYLCFRDTDIQDGDTRFKDFPPIRNSQNRSLLWDLLKMKGIDLVSSRHTSIPSEYKILENGSFRKALNGVNTLGFAMQAIWTELCESSASLEQKEHYIVRLAKWMSLSPAKVLGLTSQRGAIERGKYADLVVWSPYKKFTCKSTSNFSDTCVFEGKEVMGKVYTVIVRGKNTYDQGKFYPNGAKQVKV